MANKLPRDNRQIILDRLRRRVVDRVERPELFGDDTISAVAIGFEDPPAQFIDAVAVVGGLCHPVGHLGEVRDRLEHDPEFSGLTTRCSLVGELPGNLELGSVDDPHDLKELDLMIVQAEFGVAENGAMWITDREICHRAALFITQHLVVIVPRSCVVSNMHQAYERIGDLEQTFGVFISGPSKTADIEQSLVLGAHGCRTMTAFLVD